MWNQDKQARFEALREAERRDVLTEAERTELTALCDGLDALEAEYLGPATDKVRRERQSVEAENRQLADLLRDRKAYLAEARGLVAELEARDRQWRGRYETITGRAWAEADRVETVA